MALADEQCGHMACTSVVLEARLNRKAEVISVTRLQSTAGRDASLPTSRAPSTGSNAPPPRRSEGVLRASNDLDPDPMQRLERAEHAWQLIHDDPFDLTHADDVAAVIASFAARSQTPHADVLRCLVGIEDVDEDDARTFLEEVLEHRRQIASALGRPVHVRVAALDMLTLRPVPTSRRDSRPIIVTTTLLEKALEEATSDPVTDLPQRAHFMSLVRHELRQRRRRTACIAFIDLDRFKRVNDEFGHARGDQVLRALGVAAREVLRQGDVIARMGGDEFALLLLDVVPEEAEAVVDRLRDRFEALTRPLDTSFSAGVAMAAQDEPAESLLVRADQAMYRQKRARAVASR